MTGMIYLPKGTRLKSYKASVNGTKGVVDIKVEINDHGKLGFFLRELADIDAAQKAEAKPARPAAKTAALKALPAPTLRLPYFSGEDR